jgi:ribosomal silencing factor RsfS
VALYRENYRKVVQTQQVVQTQAINKLLATEDNKWQKVYKEVEVGQNNTKWIAVAFQQSLVHLLA